MIVKNSVLTDVPEIFHLYRIATNNVKSKNQVHWPEFPKELVLNEIAENRQWKLLIDEQFACI